MPELRIELPSGEVSTSDSATVDSIRAALMASLPEGYTGQMDQHSVPAHDLAGILRSAGRKHWAAMLDREEGATMVRVAFSG